MRRGFLMIIVLVHATSILFAQEKGFYLRAGMGYNFPQAGGTLDDEGNPFNGSITTTSTGDMVYNIKSASFSSGVQGEIGFGYMISKYLGFELDLGIGLANTKYTGNEFDTGSQGSNIVKQYAQTPVLLMPCIVLQNGGTKFNVYARAGMALQLSTKITQEETNTTLPGTSSQEIYLYSAQLTNSFSLGFTGAVGVQYNLGRSMSLWGEVNLLSLSLFPSEDDLTSVTVTQYGVSTTYPGSSIPPSQGGVVQYGKNITISASSIYNTPQPTYSIPFSNVGIHFGIMVKFPHHDYNKGRGSSRRDYSRGRG
jgi:hypothetical protein